MLNFDIERFLSIQSGAAVAGRALFDAVSTACVDGAENIFFVGTGGVAFLMEPAKILLDTHSRFPAFMPRCAELALTGSPHLSDKSIVIIPSLSGTTRETLEIMTSLKAKGAKTFVLTAYENSPLAGQADKAFVNFAADDTSSESFYVQGIYAALAILAHRGEMENVSDILAELVKLPEVLVAAKTTFEAEAKAYANKIQNEPYHIIVGAGSTWPEAHYYGMCILEEMQWIRTRPVHASDFFHGTLELVEEGVSTMLFKGEDEARPLTDRVDAFLPRFTDKVAVFDTKDFELKGLSAATRALVSPIIIATLMERLSAHLEVLRDHPLTTRRYYKRVEY